jgi:Zn-dependent M28 family amino/carboxypeptidase
MSIKKRCRLIACVLVIPTILAATPVLLPAPSRLPQTSDAAARLHAQLEAIAAGKDSAERGAAIAKQLDKLDVKVRTQPFQKQKRRGTNIIAELPNAHPAAKTLILGAHYDRVNVGQGAVDNAASCAMLLELLTRLKKSPPNNCNVHVAFWDLEEGGLHGSQAFVDAARAGGAEHKLPDAYINFDIFAYGDTLWVMSPQDDAPLAVAVRDAKRERKFPVRVGKTYPPSDHLSFIRAGVPTIAVSLIDGGEIDGVIGVISGGREAPRPDKPPRIFGIIHTPNDTLDKCDAPAIEKALPVVEQLVRRFEPPRD